MNNIQSDIQRVVDYIESLSIQCNLNSNTYGYYPASKRITAPKRYNNTIKQLCSLLHEAGHVIQTTSPAFNSKSRSVKLARCIILEQEIQAWLTGWNIARAIQIDLTTIETSYWSLYIESIDSYCKWLNSASAAECIELARAYTSKS